MPNAATPSRHNFLVVGLGASAGGLDAVRKLFDVLPADSGMAFILVQHLDPTHESLMVDLLAGHTRMKVQQAADGMPLVRDHVYVIPPATYLSIDGGMLRVSQPRERHGARMPFDFLLRSLAEELGAKAICVILSGTGADGTLGLGAIKEKGGLVIVQDPDEAGYDGMPRSAIKTGAVDFVLPVAEIPQGLATFARHLELGTAAPREPTPDRLVEIIALLRTKTPHDFALYKEGTLLRRVERRMSMAAINDSRRYLELLRRDPAELDRLANDLLINVTSFFRDAKAFEVLAETAVRDLVQSHNMDRPLRVWVPGCSTGEETYSIAMVFLEEIAASKRNIKLQVFASDVDEDAIAQAREGLYPASIATDVSPARLARFFTREDEGYRAAPELRGVVVFTVQDLLVDPPFSRIDLVSCRNLLIYLRPEAQDKVLRLFHFALCEGGILFLGGSETVGTLDDRFDSIAKAQRIYRHVGRSRPGELDFSSSGRDGIQALWPPRKGSPAAQKSSLGDLCRRLLLEAYAPASVLINRKYESLYYFGATDRYLQVASGEPSRDLLAMARDGLRNRLRAAIQRAGQEARAVVSGPRISDDDSSIAVSIAVQPVQGDGEELMLVSFLDPPKHEPADDRSAEPTDKEEISRIDELKLELDATRKELQNAIRDLEIANEEQKAINEEAMSVNEEFQSTNEELVTSKEELQSLNEELTALNSQLQETLERQRVTSSDLQNILYSADAATLFLDSGLNIRFFTPAAQSLFRVIASDVGRPLGDLTPLSADSTLLADARAVLTSSTPIKREVQGQDGAWYIRRILPYRTVDGRIEGVVITFADVSEIKAAEREIRAARAYSDSIIDTIRQPLVVLDEGHRVVSANRSFYRIFATKPDHLVGRKFGETDVHQPEIPGLRGFLDRVHAEAAPDENHEIEIELPLLGERSLLVNARKIQEGPLGERKILLAIDDITERKAAAAAVEAAKRQAEQANLGKSRFLAAASHDLRQPLQTLSLLQGLLATRIKDHDTMKLIVRLDDTLKGMSAMLNTLLDINALEAGVVRADTVSFPINDLLEQLQTEFAYEAEARGLGWRVVRCGLSVHSDPRLLDQMIRNLLSNALKYTKQGKVLLGCRRHGDKLRVEVWDTGDGIPEAQLQPIFEEFHQLDNPARERSRGFGLGLAIVQRLADLLGHAIDVRSRPGKGSVFTVDVPLGRDALVHPWRDNPDRTGETARSAGVILVVEDDPAVREMLELLLEDRGHRSVSAANGKHAIELMARQTQPPDLVIADYNLPGGLSGLQVITKLQETFHRDIPAIILTGDISTQTLRKIALQGSAHLNKPAKSEELIRMIERLLAKPLPVAKPSARPPSVVLAPGAQPPTVYVIDDDQAIRDAMRDLLEADGRRVEVYASAEMFLDALRPDQEGCLLIDAGMPGMGGLGLLQHLKREDCEIPSIMITGNGDVRMAVEAMKAGAADFIEKPIGRAELFASIQRATERTRDASKRTAWRDNATARLSGLTARQRQVMDMVLAGHPSKNIAADLGISQRTVENHRAALMKKTGSKSLPALVRLAVAAG
jgi:two-component system CheB/CheR fusion protein